MRHRNLPPTPAFQNSPPTDPVQEIALRVVVELPKWEMHVIGTACLIGGHLSRAWICPSDIAILHLGLDFTSESEPKVDWRAPLLRMTPPPSGQKVLAFGYREARIEVTEGTDGAHHIELTDIGTTSIGEVGQIFPEQRDSSMLTFPCFEVRARFAPGMSGGLVIDEDGALCGLVCAGTDFGDPNAPPLSYAATLWPMLTTVISVDRGDGYPRGVKYPMIDLALDKLIHVIGLEEQDPKLFPGRVLPRTGELGQ